jgi:molybdopterin-guanine dinucleotide biosynthesis protein A
MPMSKSNEPASGKGRSIVGAVLSGGLSARMGTQKDRILLSSGKTMMQYVIDALLKVCNEVIVAGPEMPVFFQESASVKFIQDNFPGQGPLAGIEAVLSTGIARGYLIAACDQPFLNEKLFRMLIPDDQTMPCFFDYTEGGIIQPLPGYYPVSWLPDIRDSLRRNRRALKTLIADSDVILKPIDPDMAKHLQSINTQDDLEQARGL